MDGATGLLIKLGVRFVVFGVVFFIAARKNPKVVIPVKWATPLVAAVFAILNTRLYWALRPVLDLATLGALGFAMPFIVNSVLLFVTVRFFAWHKLPRFIAKAPAGDDKREVRVRGRGEAAVPHQRPVRDAVDGADPHGRPRRAVVRARLHPERVEPGPVPVPVPMPMPR